eukprot:1149734-Pelagomonas_calceolata.AAC.2
MAAGVCHQGASSLRRRPNRHVLQGPAGPVKVFEQHPGALHTIRRDSSAVQGAHWFLACGVYSAMSAVLPACTRQTSVLK